MIGRNTAAFVSFCLIVCGMHVSAQGTVKTFLDENPIKIYGYFATRYEKVWDEPGLNDAGEIVEESSPGEFGNPFFHVMLQQQIAQKFKIFVNLNGEDFETVDVRNAWGEYAHSDKLKIRLGKTYRKFGLYNEILDAVPAYFGIEAPELFDGDHLLISRTTTLMVHGTTTAGEGLLHYSFSTDNGEGGARSGSQPLGFDMHYTSGFDNHKIGVSAYTSNGETTSDIGVGEGSPNSGVLPWMAEDEFEIFGGYYEGVFGKLTVQAEFWNSAHDGVRDPDAVLTVIENAGLLDTQLARFLIDPHAAATVDNVDLNGDYDVETWYLRAGYTMDSRLGEWVPYFQWDFYSNPETIANKTYGGDNEAGAADDGEFDKVTLGLAFRPSPNVAVKLDASQHRYTLKGQSVDYPEIRFDVSWVFGR